VASVDPPDELLRRAGFDDVIELDATDEFRSVAKAWIDQWDEHRGALIEVYGQSEFENRQADRRLQLRAVEDGLLRRSLFIGSGPADRGSVCV
jgi:hypothetical protein